MSDPNMEGVVNVESAHDVAVDVEFGTLRPETLTRKWLGGNELASAAEVPDPPLSRLLGNIFEPKLSNEHGTYKTVEARFWP